MALFSKSLYLLIALQLCFVCYCKASYQEEFKNQSKIFHFKVLLLCCGSIPEEQKPLCKKIKDGSPCKTDVNLSIIPIEIIYYISLNMSPKNILTLRKLNKYFSELFGDQFWTSYNKYHDFDEYNLNASSIEISFSNYWYQEAISRNDKNLLKKAAGFKHPEALKKLNLSKLKKKKLKESQTLYQSKFYILWLERYK